ncbi:Kelch-like protein 1 [Varanus komodoensis]|nr:Kelch-like protein 1 [Varanus komodoensis]
MTMAAKLEAGPSPKSNGKVQYQVQVIVWNRPGSASRNHKKRYTPGKQGHDGCFAYRNSFSSSAVDKTVQYTLFTDAPRKMELAARMVHRFYLSQSSGASRASIEAMRGALPDGGGWGSFSPPSHVKQQSYALALPGVSSRTARLYIIQQGHLRLDITGLPVTSLPLTPQCDMDSSSSEEFYQAVHHAEQTFRKMESYLKQQQLCDVILIAGNRKIPAHSAVLMICEYSIINLQPNPDITKDAI